MTERSHRLRSADDLGAVGRRRLVWAQLLLRAMRTPPFSVSAELETTAVALAAAMAAVIDEELEMDGAYDEYDFDDDDDDGEELTDA